MHADTIQERVLLNLLRGGTALFVFISGFLFYYLHPDAFDWQRFLRQKLSFVVLPYLVTSAVPVAYYAARHTDWTPLHGATGLSALWEPARDFLGRACTFLANGSHVVGYWYVPFIMVMFVLSPLFRWYGRLGPAPRLAIMGLGTALSMLIHRPVENLSVAQSVVYYTPVYLLGSTVAALAAEKYWFVPLGPPPLSTPPSRPPSLSLARPPSLSLSHTYAHRDNE